MLLQNLAMRSRVIFHVLYAVACHACEGVNTVAMGNSMAFSLTGKGLPLLSSLKQGGHNAI